MFAARSSFSATNTACVGNQNDDKNQSQLLSMAQESARSVLRAECLHRSVSQDDFSSITGLPEELDIEGDLERAEQRVSIQVDERRYGKAMTIVEGLDQSAIDIADLASELKSQLATGGTVDDGRIELQGDHADRLHDLLEDRGFTVEA
jgi:translation initiation factor 1